MKKHKIALVTEPTPAPVADIRDRFETLGADYLLTKHEARQLLRMGARALEAKIKSNELITVSHSPKRTFVRVGDVRAYLKANSSDAPPIGLSALRKAKARR